MTSQYAEDELLDMARQFSFRSRMDRTRRSGPVQALQDSAETLIHSHMRLFNDREIILASRMAEISPPGMNPPLADLLKNRFYTGSVSYKGEYFHGQHEALISQEVFDLTQDALRKNNGRSCTLASRPTRQYLLKGIVRCAHCMMPMWAQTYASGHSYYREHRNSMRHGPCPAVSGSISCEIADEQVSKLVTAIELGPRWMEKVMAIVAVKDQVEDAKHQRKLVIEKLHRPAQAYVDGHYPKDQYRQAKRRLELELESLVVPEVSAAEEAGRLLTDLPTLWREANLEERRKLLMAMLDAVYVETRELKQVVAIQPKPAFAPVFQVVSAREGSGVVLIKESPRSSFEPGETDLCSWWRRGRVGCSLFANGVGPPDRCLVLAYAVAFGRGDGGESNSA